MKSCRQDSITTNSNHGDYLSAVNLEKSSSHPPPGATSSRNVRSMVNSLDCNNNETVDNGTVHTRWGPATSSPRCTKTLDATACLSGEARAAVTATRPWRAADSPRPAGAAAAAAAAASEQRGAASSGRGMRGTTRRPTSPPPFLPAVSRRRGRPAGLAPVGRGAGAPAGCPRLPGVSAKLSMGRFSVRFWFLEGKSSVVGGTEGVCLCCFLLCLLCAGACWWSGDGLE